MSYESINDPGKQWIKKYTLALVKELLGSIRGKYSSIVGETTDTGYGFEVIQNRISRTGYSRKDRERIDVAEQGNYLTRIDSRRPEAVFYNIANLSEKFLKAKNTTEKGDILTEIENQKAS